MPACIYGAVVSDVYRKIDGKDRRTFTPILHASPQ